MKNVMVFFVCLLATIVIPCKYARAEYNEICFIYEDNYEGTVTTSVVLRNEYNEQIGVIPEGDQVLVKGFIPNNSERILVEWNGIEGTVLRQYVEKNKLYAVTKFSVDQFDTFGNYIQTIPEGERVIIENNNDESSACVEWNGIQGNVQADGINKDFIFINILEQNLSMYKDAKKICETSIVTGTDGTDRQTPTGIFSIQYMSRSTILKGEGYESYVEYWMPFYYGYGIHDATWRGDFGGDIYKYNGSHGCVNVPLYQAQILYENAYVGMLVIIK